MDESAVQTKLGELSNKITAFKAQLDESNEVKMMLEQQLESSNSKYAALGDEYNEYLKDKCASEEEFEEKILNLESQCLEQQGLIESLREEKRSIQETSDDLGSQSKGNFFTYTRLHNIKESTETHMI